MKIHRFITEYEVKSDEVIIADADLLHQWKNVLKFKVGEQLVLSDTLGHEAMCEITDMSKKEAVLKVISEDKNTKEANLNKNVTLYLAILKKENFEFVAQKATELGVSTIVPVKTDRTVKQNLNFERLNKIVKEASEQCGKSTIPEIKEIMYFEDAVKHSEQSAHRILFDSTGTKISHRSDLWDEKASRALFIGPEGGFTEKEIHVAKESGMEITSISPLTLRGETAAIIAVYIGVSL